MVIRIEEIQNDEDMRDALKKHLEGVEIKRQIFLKRIKLARERQKNYKQRLTEKKFEELTEEEKEEVKRQYIKIKGITDESSIAKIPLRYMFVELSMVEIGRAFSGETNPFTEEKYFLDSMADLEIFYYAIDKESLTPENIEKTKKYCQLMLQEGQEIRVCIDGEMLKQKNNSKINYVYSAEEMNAIIELNNFLVQNGMIKEIMFSEMTRFIDDSFDKDGCWTLSQVLKTNNDLDAIVERIKAKNLSPFETMLEIHTYITSTFRYNTNGLESSRVLPGIFNNQEIVCSGYASLVKAIIDKLGMPELECDLVSCKFVDEHNEIMEAHCHNLVKIRDKKYGIDGYYVEDACWDSKELPFYGEAEKGGEGVAHCLYPVSDVLNFNEIGKYVSNDEDNMFSNIIFNMSEIQGGIKGRIKTAIKNLKARTKGYVPTIVKNYGKNSPPIPLETYARALRIVYNDEPNAEEMIEFIINGSISRAKKVFNLKATSNFVCGSKENGAQKD